MPDLDIWVPTVLFSERLEYLEIIILKKAITLDSGIKRILNICFSEKHS